MDDWEPFVRAALGDNYKHYELFKVEKTWQSHHAYFAKVRLSKQRRRGEDHISRLFVAKYYIPVGGNHEQDYGAYHHPDALWQRELRNFKNIEQLVSAEFSRRFLRSFLPIVEASSREHHTLVLPYLGGSNLKKKILKESDLDLRHLLFLSGVKLSARFNGVCNSLRSGFDQVKGFDYSRDGDFLERVSLAMLKENIARTLYNSREDCRTLVKSYNLGNGISEQEADQYNLNSVLFYIHQNMGVDIDSRLKEIKQKEVVLSEKRKLQHRDCNGLNMVNGKMLDLEDFGYGPWTLDLAQNCIIVGLGNNIMLREKNFISALQAYLAIEHAYEVKRDKELGQKLENATNGAFKQYVGNNFDEENYSNFLASFFYRSIEKNVQLAASFSRYKSDLSVETGGVGSETPQTVLRELFLMVWDLSSRKDFEACSDVKGVRGLFYELGRFYNDVRVGSIDNYILEGIRDGIKPGDSIASGRPEFLKK